jgi:hypothetical protein
LEARIGRLRNEKLVPEDCGMAGVCADTELALAGPMLSTGFEGSTLELVGYGENTWFDMDETDLGPFMSGVAAGVTLS